MGNLGSIENMIKRIGAKCIISRDADDITLASKMILPGVGKFDQAMLNIKHRNIMDVLLHKILIDKTPILGICLGMQLLCKRSEEGLLEGLGIIDAEVKKFSSIAGLKIPHMGWNTANIQRENLLFRDMQQDLRFYFVHSYHVNCFNSRDVISTTTYGYEFTSAINSGNIYGVQFHPEKSHKYGMQLLRNFVELI